MQNIYLYITVGMYNAHLIGSKYGAMYDDVYDSEVHLTFIIIIIIVTIIR